MQVLIREYDFDNKKHPTFREDDIMNLFPVVKHTNPKVRGNLGTAVAPSLIRLLHEFSFSGCASF